MTDASGQQTFQSWDSIDGGAGNNTLNVQNALAAPVLTPQLANIQTLNFQDTVGTGITLNVQGLSTLTALNLEGATAGSGYTINNLGSLPAVTISGAGAASVLNFTAAALAPTGQTLNLTLNGFAGLAGAAGGGITLSDTGANTLETVSITASGSASNVGGLTTSGLGVATLNVNGDQNITLGAITDSNATLKTVNASSLTGFISLTAIANSTVTGGAGNDTVTSSGGTDSFTGGTGSDTFSFPTAGFLTNLDTINGGDGTDQIRANYADFNGYVQVLTPTISNVEQIGVLDAATGAITTAALSSSINTVILRANGNTGAVITFPTSAATVTVGVANAGAAGTGTLTGALTINDTGTSTTDTLTINVGNVTAAGVGVNALGAQDIAINGYETVTLNTGVAGAVQTVDDITITADAGANTVLNITGAAGLTTTAGGGATGVITARTIDASGLTGNGALIMAAAAAGVASITGSANADTLIGDASTSINGGAGSDSIVGGALNDTLIGGDGNDTITAGAGNDSIDAGAGNDQVIIAGADVTSFDTISGGDGVDLLSLTAVAADITATNAASVSNFETLQVAGGAVTALTLSNFVNNSGFTQINVANTAAGALTLNNASNSVTTLGMLAGSQGDTIVFDRLVDTTTNALTILNTDGSNLTAGGLGAITSITAGEENTITIATDNFNGLTTTTGAMTVTTLVGAQLENLVVTGQSAVTVGTATTPALKSIDTSGSTAAVTVNAAASNVNLTLTSGTGSQNITSGVGADSLVGGSAADTLIGGGGRDTITGNGGNDNIEGGIGADSMTGGAGVDDYLVTATSSVVASGATVAGIAFAVGDIVTFGNGVDVISDFTAGAGGDTLSVTTAGAATSLTAAGGITIAGNAAYNGLTYFASGTFNSTTGAFTLATDGVGPDTLVMIGTNNTSFTAVNTSAVVLVGVDSDNLVAGNFIL